MKNNDMYLLIFIVVAMIIGGVIMFNARNVSNMADRAVVSQVPATQNMSQEIDTKTQKEIDMMRDADIEADLEDVMTDENVDLSDIEDLMTEESVTF